MSQSDQGVSIETVKEFLSYDPNTGVIRWKRSPSNNIYAGDVAGCVKALRKNASGKDKSYSYVRIEGMSIPAQRIAWALHNGEWPPSRITFIDGDSLNFKIANLKLQNSLPQTYEEVQQHEKNQYYREHRKAFKLSYSESELNRKYGIGLLEYSQLFMSQGGKCAICNSDYGGHRNGEPKALAVDHNHTTGKVRGLLCESCNQGIGKLRDDPKILRDAADYLEKHSSDSSAEHPGSLAPSTGPADTARTMERNLVQEER